MDMAVQLVSHVHICFGPTICIQVLDAAIPVPACDLRQQDSLHGFNY
jgi:hypothetical protein